MSEILFGWNILQILREKRNFICLFPSLNDSIRVDRARAELGPTGQHQQRWNVSQMNRPSSFPFSLFSMHAHMSVFQFPENNLFGMLYKSYVKRGTLFAFFHLWMTASEWTELGPSSGRLDNINKDEMCPKWIGPPPSRLVSFQCMHIWACFNPQEIIW